MGGFQNFAISFTIISILAGCLTSYYIAFNEGGPVAVSWGWLLVGLLSTLIALAMARDRLGVPDRGRPLLLGVEARQPGLGLVHRLVQPHRADRRHRGDRLRPGDVRDRAVQLLVRLLQHEGVDRSLTYSVVMLLAVIVNMFKVRITAMLNTISAYWHMAGVAFIVLVLIVVPDRHQSLGYVFGETINNSGFSGNGFGAIVFWFVFGLGLLMSQYTITGLRRLGAHGRGDAAGLADGRGRHVHVGRRVGDLRLDPAARGDVRGARHAGRARRGRQRGRLHLGRVDEPELGGERCSSSAASRSSSA